MQLYELEEVALAEKLTVIFPRAKKTEEFSGPGAAREMCKKLGKAEVTAITAGVGETDDALVFTCTFPGVERGEKSDLSGLRMDESIFAPKTEWGYLLNISHPKVVGPFERFRKEHTDGVRGPLGDADRFRFEAMYLAALVKKLVQRLGRETV